MQPLETQVSPGCQLVYSLRHRIVLRRYICATNVDAPSLKVKPNLENLGNGTSQT